MHMHFSMLNSWVSHAKMAEVIEVLFGRETCVGPRNPHIRLVFRTPHKLKAFRSFELWHVDTAVQSGGAISFARRHTCDTSLLATINYCLECFDLLLL